jgi:hypothetical protein
MTCCQREELQVEKANDRHRRLLRLRPQRRRCRAAEQRDEVAPFHSLTSSAEQASQPARS